MPRLCGISRGGAEMIENWIVGVIAVALIVYLFVALVRPDKF
jgi:K+-transporting ATPase KdpF subunit